MPGLNCEVRWETRLCEVEGELGYFHLWEQWADVVAASALKGGHLGGQVGRVYGIVEFKDGVRRVDPAKIKFCDEANAVPNAMSSADWSRVHSVTPEEIKNGLERAMRGENNAEN